jgi:hypothetical protein
MQLVVRRYFSKSNPHSLRNILEKEIIPAQKESTHLFIQDSLPLESSMETKSSVRSK